MKHYCYYIDELLLRWWITIIFLLMDCYDIFIILTNCYVVIILMNCYYIVELLLYRWVVVVGVIILMNCYYIVELLLYRWVVIVVGVIILIHCYYCDVCAWPQLVVALVSDNFERDKKSNDMLMYTMDTLNKNYIIVVIRPSLNWMNTNLGMRIGKDEVSWRWLWELVG